MFEADTCRTYVLPKLYAADWKDEQIREQVTFTAGRIIPTPDGGHTRKQGKRADYILRYRQDFPLAVVEAKAEYKLPGDGLQQAMDYAEALGLKFAYATNGKGIIEHDYITGKQTKLEGFPSPFELWERWNAHEQIADADTDAALFPFYRQIGGKEPRYYQQIAINRAVQAVIQNKKRILITMATGTGKTFVAFQIVWRLWKARRKTKILYLADRNVLIDQAKDRDFAPIGGAAIKLQGKANKAREVYFAIYQALADREGFAGLYQQYPRDFFDLIIVDECHRGSADAESSWRRILEYFDSATQIGMTATPKRDANVDTYNYFGAPIYTYALKTGIDDGFLAPYRVQRVVPNVDATGWRPSPQERDRYGKLIPDGVYGSKEFERIISMFARTQAVANHLTQFLHNTNPMDKTIVFCVDQEHAEDMRLALAQANIALVQKYPHYVARVVSDEGGVGRGHLDNFQDPERATPVILTTSMMLTTGVDAPTCKNIVLFKPIASMVEFKQIIGRGTRVAEERGKAWFNIIDYTGATALFADKDFDGEPALPTRKETIDTSGNILEQEEEANEPLTDSQGEIPQGEIDEPPVVLPPDINVHEPRKYYVDGVNVWISVEQVMELDPDGHILKTVSYEQYIRDQTRRLMPTAEHLRIAWSAETQRDEIARELAQRGIDLDKLARILNRTDADALDLLLNVAYNAPILSRRERAQKLKSSRPNFWNEYQPQARQVLEILLDKYADYGISQLTNFGQVLQVPPLDAQGTVMEIAARFGDAGKMKQAVEKMESLLYAE
ncbi:DEAD/DEAH box helicase [Anaerolineae bacterium CFX7]|nr:DEAD/DEAH box helicase [Anaerolineae bacterium CFX7]